MAQGGVALDFNASPGPHETERYVVHSVRGGGADAGPRGGIRVESSPTIVRVSNGKVLSYAVPDDLLGFLKGVANSRREFLREDSAGLFIRYRDDIHYRVGGRGPMASRRGCVCSGKGRSPWRSGSRASKPSVESVRSVRPWT